MREVRGRFVEKKSVAKFHALSGIGLFVQRAAELPPELNPAFQMNRRFRQDVPFRQTTLFWTKCFRDPHAAVTNALARHAVLGILVSDARGRWEVVMQERAKVFSLWTP